MSGGAGSELTVAPPSAGTAGSLSRDSDAIGIALICWSSAGVGRPSRGPDGKNATTGWSLGIAATARDAADADVVVPLAAALLATVDADESVPVPVDDAAGSVVMADEPGSDGVELSAGAGGAVVDPESVDDGAVELSWLGSGAGDDDGAGDGSVTGVEIGNVTGLVTVGVGTGNPWSVDGWVNDARAMPPPSTDADELRASTSAARLTFLRARVVTMHSNRPRGPRSLATSRLPRWLRRRGGRRCVRRRLTRSAAMPAAAPKRWSPTTGLGWP